ncbi:MAG: hypothetical protein ACRD0W_10335 [Acidimicrobiales bacterium]
MERWCTPPGPTAHGIAEAAIDRLLTLIGALPVGLDRWVATAAGRERLERSAAPPTIVALLLLALVPVIVYGVELIVMPTTISDLVERRTGSTTTLVEFDGFALVLPFAAEAPATGDDRWPAYRWLAVHDHLTDPQFALVRTPLEVDALSRRMVVARVIRDRDAVTASAEALGARGVVVDVAALGEVLLDEIDQVDPADEVRSIASLADLDSIEAGSLVRVALVFSGAGVASCAAEASCDARRLAQGSGAWDQLAEDAAGTGRSLVRTSYPPSVAPFAGVGRQTRDQATVDQFLALPWVDGLIGWTRLLRLAHVEHDLSLPVNRAWVGPILFVLAAGLLLMGLQVGYPRFRVEDASIHRWGVASAWPTGREVTMRTSGRIIVPGGVPIDVDRVEGRVRPVADDAGAQVELTIPGNPLTVTIPRAVAGLGTVESGTLSDVRGARASLRVGWFGSQLLMVFASAVDRDRVAALVRQSH